MDKRISCRGMIFSDKKLATMYREKNGKILYYPWWWSRKVRN